MYSPLGADNPDNYYLTAALNGTHEYRISGRRNLAFFPWRAAVRPVKSRLRPAVSHRSRHFLAFVILINTMSASAVPVAVKM